MRARLSPGCIAGRPPAFSRAGRGTLLVLLAVGLAASSAATAAGGSGLTLEASRHVAGLPAVPWGTSIELSGNETLGDQTVVLQAQTFPFTKPFQTVAQENTSGPYSFSVKPSHATRYQVQAGGETSPVLTVYVFERELRQRCSLCNLGNTAGSHTLTVTGLFQAPPGALARLGPVYFYYAQNNGSSRTPTKLHRVETARLHVRGHRLSFKIRYGVSFPLGSFRFSFDYCWKDHESKDGLGLPGHHHCGAATVKGGSEYLG